MTALISTIFLSIHFIEILQYFFAFLYISFIVLLGFSALRRFLGTPVEKIERAPVEKVKSKEKASRVSFEEYSFDYSNKNHIRCLYYGEEVLFATIVQEKVYFCWSHSRKQAAPVLAYREDKTTAIETVFKNTYKRYLAVLNKRTTGEPEVWDILKPELVKQKRSRIDIEVN
jgi:hypothetical protein